MAAPDLQKYLPTFALVGGGLLVAKLLKDSIFSGGESGPPEQEPPNPANLTYTPGEFAYFAEQIYVAMWGVSGWDISEDEELAYTYVMKCRNNDDLRALSQAYDCRGPALSIGCMTLSETLREFMPSSMVAALNNELRLNGLTIGI